MICIDALGAANLNIYIPFKADTQPELENFRLFSHFGMQDENEIVQSNLGVIKTMWISRAMHFKCETRVPSRESVHEASVFLFIEEFSWNENVKPSATVARKQKHVAPQSLSSLPPPLFSPLMDSSNYSFVFILREI